MLDLDEAKKLLDQHNAKVNPPSPQEKPNLFVFPELKPEEQALHKANPALEQMRENITKVATPLAGMFKDYTDKIEELIRIAKEAAGSGQKPAAESTPVEKEDEPGDADMAQQSKSSNAASSNSGNKSASDLEAEKQAKIQELEEKMHIELKNKADGIKKARSDKATEQAKDGQQRG